MWRSKQAHLTKQKRRKEGREERNNLVIGKAHVADERERSRRKSL
jgi:hypothetical protein